MNSPHKPTALVLGANGYLGQNLCWWLHSQGYNVEAVARQPHWKGHAHGLEAIAYTQADLADPQQVAQISFHADIVFMMAGITGTSVGFTRYADLVLSNEIALLNVLQTMQEQLSEARLVFPSTRLVYKGADSFLGEAAPKETKTVYAVNKLACEHYLYAWKNSFGIHYTVFRICVPYGHLLPGNYAYGTLGFMRRQAQEHQRIQLYGDGSQRRTFTHVEDICRLMTEAAGLPGSDGEIYNIGGGDHHSLSELATMISLQTGASIEFKPWPESDLKIESGDTVFSDAKLAGLMPVVYLHRLRDYLAALPHL